MNTARKRSPFSTLIATVLAALLVALLCAVLCAGFGSVAGAILHFNEQGRTLATGFGAGCGFWYIMTQQWDGILLAWKGLRAESNRMPSAPDQPVRLVRKPLK